MPVKTKTCPRCIEKNGPLPLTAFGRNAQNPDGLHYYCRACAREIQRQWAKDNAQKVKDAKQRYRDKLRKRNNGRDPYTPEAQAA